MNIKLQIDLMVNSVCLAELPSTQCVVHQTEVQTQRLESLHTAMYAISMRVDFFSRQSHL